MDAMTAHSIGDIDGVSVDVGAVPVDGDGVKNATVSPNGLSPELLAHLAALAEDKVRGGGLRLMGEGGLLTELTQHLMQAALEAEMELHLAAEAGRVGGRGSR